MTSLAQQMASTAESAQDVLKEQARLEAEKRKSRRLKHKNGMKQALSKLTLSSLKSLQQLKTFHRKVRDNILLVFSQWMTHTVSVNISQGVISV
jgi:hypothetical protein